MTLALAIAPLPDAPQAERGAWSPAATSANAAPTAGGANFADAATAANTPSQLTLCAGPSEREQVGFELGWAHAHHGISRPAASPARGWLCA